MATPPQPARVADPSRLSAVERALGVMADAEPGVTRLTRLARDVLGARFGLVTLVDDRWELLHAPVGLPWGVVEVGRLPVADALCTTMIESGSPFVVPDLLADERLRNSRLADLGVRSYAGVPILLDGHVLGGFCVADVVPHDWTGEDVRVLCDLAEAVSTELRLRTTSAELETARNLERRLADEQAALRRVATSVARNDPPELQLRRAAQEVARLLEVEAALVLRFQPNGRVEVAGHAPERHEPDAQACAGIVARLRLSGRPEASGTGEEVCLAAPVVVGERLWGAVVAVGASENDSLQHLARLADLVALGVAGAEAQARLIELSRTDPLTGADNRRAFDERLASEIERARRHGTSTTLAVLDVDHFKRLNDSEGHDAGDRVLQELVARVLAHLRAGDVLARLGGDEFALLLPETDYGAALVVVDRIRDEVASARLAGRDVTVTIGGVVVERGEAGADELYRSADRALYRAKDAGRNTVVLEALR